MGQHEILVFLENYRVLTDKWLTPREVYKELMKAGTPSGDCRKVGNALYKLAAWNLIEWRGVGIWNHRKEFRGKKLD